MNYIFFIITIFIIINIFTLLLKLKIDKLEEKIILSFKTRNNQIPFLYNLTKWQITKQDEVFKTIMELKQSDFSEDSFDVGLNKKLRTYELIHKETNFIFKVCEKHEKFTKNELYNYIKDSKLEKSLIIWENIDLYKKIIKKFNVFLTICNITLIWFLFPLWDKKII